MITDLRGRVEAALEPVIWTEFASTGEPVVCVQRDAAVAAVVTLFSEVLDLVLAAERDHPMLGICRYCRTPEGIAHGMRCPEYTGPVWHYMVGARQLLHSPGALYRCTCGRSWWDGGLCPNRSETWRGPRPPDEKPWAG